MTADIVVRLAIVPTPIAPVAQRIEHLTTDQKVGGSNPFGRTGWQTVGMSTDDRNIEGIEPGSTDHGTNASGNQSDSAVTWDTVDSGQSEDIENSLTAQGTSDRETTREVTRDELIEQAEAARRRRAGEV